MYVTIRSFILSKPSSCLISLSLSLSLVSSEQCRHFLMDDDDDGGRNTPSTQREGAKGVVARIYKIGPLHFGRTFCYEVAGFTQPSARHGSRRKTSRNLGHAVCYRPYNLANNLHADWEHGQINRLGTWINQLCQICRLGSSSHICFMVSSC